MQYWETIADKLSVTGKSSESQTGGVLAQFLITSLTLGIGKAIDAAALVGSGVSGQPLGIFNRAGSVSSVTFGAAATWAKLVGTSSFESQLLTSNIESSNIRWVAHPAVKAKFRSVQRFSGAAETLWDSDRDYIGGHEAFTTTSVSSTTGLIALTSAGLARIANWRPPGRAAPIACCCSCHLRRCRYSR